MYPIFENRGNYRAMEHIIAWNSSLKERNLNLSQFFEAYHCGLKLSKENDVFVSPTEFWKTNRFLIRAVNLLWESNRHWANLLTLVDKLFFIYLLTRFEIWEIASKYFLVGLLKGSKMCRLNSLACQQTEVILVNTTTCADLSFATIEGSTNFLFTFPIWQTKVFNLAGIAAPPKRIGKFITWNVLVVSIFFLHATTNTRRVVNPVRETILKRA